jgi:hypothetical protein
MATLVLTTVGSVIGGPLGGAIGSILGQQIDRSLFAPKPREGPRIKELDVQTSSYGSRVPAIFGVMRVAGTVIWATDLIERRVKNGGGKGRPSTVSYSYSVSMAVAISSRPVARIGRIWADGNLLRGENGGLKVEGELRLFEGHDDQPCDPLMASDAFNQCPAYRGIAYAIFEDLQLADFGNRIPSLTFEVFEREGPVPVVAIFEETAEGLISGVSTQMAAGYAVTGSDAREALAPLLEVLPITLKCHDDKLTITDDSGSAFPVPNVVAVSAEGLQQFKPPIQKREPAGMAPRSVSLRYYDRARDFQAGIQRSDRGDRSRTSIALELAAVLEANQAKLLAEQYNLKMQSVRLKWSGQVALSSSQISAGDSFADPSGGIWRVEQIEHHFCSMTISAHALFSKNMVAMQADPGRNLSSPDIDAGQTQITAVDLPVFDSTDPGRQQIAVFAAGTARGWKRSALSVQQGDGLADIGPTAAPALMGYALTALPSHHNLFLDETSTLDVRLLNTSMDIPETNGSALSPNALYFWLAGEFIRFGKSTALGNGQYRLSQFQRGCFGGDIYSPDHQIGDRFVLLDIESARLLDGPDLPLGIVVTVEALGVGDVESVTSSVTVKALATRPPSPVHGTATRLADGSLQLQWKRRSRVDLGWRDGVEQILIEKAEVYQITALSDRIKIREWESHENQILISAQEFAELTAVVSNPVFAVRQVGTHLVSDDHRFAVSSSI